MLLVIPGIGIQSFDLGVRGGLNISSFIGDDVPGKVGYRYGYHFGTNISLDVSESLTIQPGIFYTTRGEARDRTLYMSSDPDEFVLRDSVNYDYRYFLNYISLEFLFKLNFVNNNTYYLSGCTGLSFMGLVSATETKPYTRSTVEEKDIRSEHFDLDMELLIGLVFQLKSISERIYIGAYYKMGIIPVRKGTFQPDIRTSAYSIFLRYVLID